jgi:NADH dehydrogenase
MVDAGREQGVRRDVVVGGGFGGLEAVRALREEPVAVTLIDRRSFHLLQPLVCQVATGVLAAGEIAASAAGARGCGRRDARFRQGTIATAEPNAVPSAGCTAMCR